MYWMGRSVSCDSLGNPSLTQKSFNLVQLQLTPENSPLYMIYGLMITLQSQIHQKTFIFCYIHKLEYNANIVNKFKKNMYFKK